MIISEYDELRSKTGHGPQDTRVYDTGVTSLDGKIYYALSDDNELALLVPLRNAIEMDTLKLSDAIRLKPKVFEEEGKWLLLVCAYAELEKVFCHFVNALLNYVEPHKSAFGSINTVFQEFVHLLEPKKEKATISEVAGLIGELLFLHELSKKDSSAINLWVGPSGGQHDFVGESADIEVKASTRIGKTSVTISSLEQLTIFLDRNLYLLHYSLELHPNGDLSVERLVDMIVNEGVALSQLEPELQKIGCNDYRSEEWNLDKFNYVKASCYQVKDQFPRIATDLLIDGKVLPGVSNASYDIDLTMADGYITDVDQAILELL